MSLGRLFRRQPKKPPEREEKADELKADFRETIRKLEAFSKDLQEELREGRKTPDSSSSEEGEE